MSKSIEQAKADLAKMVPYLRQAATDATQRAGKGSRIEFAIVSKRPDGSGTVGAVFECEEFLSDMEAVFPPSEADKADAEAACLLAKAPTGRPPS